MLNLREPFIGSYPFLALPANALIMQMRIMIERVFIFISQSENTCHRYNSKASSTINSFYLVSHLQNSLNHGVRQDDHTRHQRMQAESLSKGMKPIYPDDFFSLHGSADFTGVTRRHQREYTRVNESIHGPGLSIMQISLFFIVSSLVQLIEFRG